MRLAGELRSCFEMPQGPDSKIGPVLYREFPENTVQILLNCAFSQVQFEGDLFIQFGLTDEPCNLLFTK